MSVDELAAVEEITSVIRILPDGRTEVRCPHCETWADLLDYRPLEVTEKYADDLNVVMRCRRCRHCFSPRRL